MHLCVSVLLYAHSVSCTPELFHPAVNELWLQHTGHKGAQKLPVPSENGPSNIDEFILSPFWCVECTLMEFNWRAFHGLLGVAPAQDNLYQRESQNSSWLIWALMFYFTLKWFFLR